jgi:hypothetical protein
MTSAQAQAEQNRAARLGGGATQRLDVFFGRTDNTRGYKQYACVIVSTAAETIQYWDDVYEPRDCEYTVLEAVDSSEVESKYGIPASSTVGWVAEPLKGRMLARYRGTQAFKDGKFTDALVAYTEGLELLGPSPEARHAESPQLCAALYGNSAECCLREGQQGGLSSVTEWLGRARELAQLSLDLASPGPVAQKAERRLRRATEQLDSLSRESPPAGGPEAAAPVLDEDGRLSPRTGRWRLFVDYLSPASQVMLALVHRLGLQGSDIEIVEHPMKWSDFEDSPVEWEKPDPKDCVPRLECQATTGAASSDPDALVLCSPNTIFRTILMVWGDGRLQGPAALTAIEKARREQVCEEAWAKLVKPISAMLFECCWSCGAVKCPTVREVAKALTWAHVEHASRPAPDQGQSTLDIILGVPVSMYAMASSGGKLPFGQLQAYSLAICPGEKFLGSYIIVDACENLPGFDPWLKRCLSHESIGGVVYSALRSSKHSAHYAQQMFQGEVSGLAIVSKMNSGGFSEYLSNPGGQAPTTLPPWPYLDTTRHTSEMDRLRDALPSCTELTLDDFLRRDQLDKAYKAEHGMKDDY